jgi:hypothetical protein
LPLCKSSGKKKGGEETVSFSSKVQKVIELDSGFLKCFIIMNENLNVQTNKRTKKRIKKRKKRKQRRYFNSLTRRINA